MVLHRFAIDQHAQCPPHGWIGEEGMLGVNARALSLAIMPPHAALAFPSDRHCVGSKVTVFAARNLGGENRKEIAFGIPTSQWFVENARAVLIFGADCEVRIEQGYGLPI